MKAKIVLGLAMFASCCASANAAPHANNSISLGFILLPAAKLIDTGGAMLSPVLQPVLSKTGPAAGEVVASLHPVFVVVGRIARPHQHQPAEHLPALPGLPN